MRKAADRDIEFTERICAVMSISISSRRIIALNGRGHDASSVLGHASERAETLVPEVGILAGRISHWLIVWHMRLEMHGRKCLGHSEPQSLIESAIDYPIVPWTLVARLRDGELRGSV